MTRAWTRPCNGCASWIGSCRSRACGSATPTKISSARWPRPGPTRPTEAEFLGNAAFHRLFLTPRQLKPRLVVKGSGIDWLAVSAEWEAEGMKLSKADLERLAAATSRFVKLPNAGWVELDTARRAGRARSHGGHGRGRPHRRAAKSRHGTRRASGRRGIHAFCRHARGAGAARARARFQGRAQRANCRHGLQAELRPYQKDGFDFLAHLVAGQARRHSGRRHGPGQNAANADLAGLAQGAQHEKSQAVARHLSRRPCCTTGGARRRNSRRT